MGHGTRMNNSYHPYECEVPCHIDDWVMSHESCHTCMNESCHTDEWVMWNRWMSHVTQMNESYRTLGNETHKLSGHTFGRWVSHVTHLECECHMRLPTHDSQYNGIHCNTLQHTAIHCNTLQHTWECHMRVSHETHNTWLTAHCNTLQHTSHVLRSLILNDIHPHTHTYIYIYIYTPIYVYMYIYTHIYVYIYMYIYIHTRTHTYSYNICIHIKINKESYLHEDITLYIHLPPTGKINIKWFNKFIPVTSVYKKKEPHVRICRCANTYT